MGTFILNPELDASTSSGKDELVKLSTDNVTLAVLCCS